MRMTEKSGQLGEPVDRLQPDDFAIQAKTPDTGFISRFFQISAADRAA